MIQTAGKKTARRRLEEAWIVNIAEIEKRRQAEQARIDAQKTMEKAK